MKKILTLSFILISINCSYSQWTQLTNWEGLSFATEGNDYIYAGTWFYGVNVSTNNGDSWINVLPNHTIRNITVIGSNIFAVDTFMYVSTNHGLTWDKMTNTPIGMYSTFVSGTDIYGVSYGTGVYKSNDMGNSWSFLSSQISSVYTSGVAVDGNNIFYGTYHHNNISARLYLSTNKGNSWNYIYYGDPTGLTNVSQIVFDLNHNMYLGAFGGSHGALLYSTNYGFNFSNISNNIPHPNILALALYGNNIFIGNEGSPSGGTDTGGIYISGNNGASWIKKSEGMNTVQVGFDFIKVFNNYVFTSTQYGIYRSSLSEITEVEPKQNSIPDKFSLSPNYPNPFNPSTKISYDLPISGFVNLVIYDVLGREVKTLVNEKQNAGTYEVNWDASSNPSGVYFYKLTVHQDGSSTGDFTETRKMALLK